MSSTDTGLYRYYRMVREPLIWVSLLVLLVSNIVMLGTLVQEGIIEFNSSEMNQLDTGFTILGILFVLMILFWVLIQVKQLLAVINSDR